MATSKTRVATVSNTKLAVGTAALIIAGGAAFGFGLLPGKIGYSGMKVTCHNGNTAIYSQSGSFVENADGRRQVPPIANCASYSTWKNTARAVCEEPAVNPQAKKRGINSFHITGRCRIASQPYWYRRPVSGNSSVFSSGEGERKKSGTGTIQSTYTNTSNLNVTVKDGSRK